MVAGLVGFLRCTVATRGFPGLAMVFCHKAPGALVPSHKVPPRPTYTPVLILVNDGHFFSFLLR